MSDTQPMETKTHFRIRRFALDKIRAGNSVVLIGRRETGKTVIVKDILWHNQTIPCGTVICGVDGVDIGCRNYGSVVPPQMHYDEYSPDIIRAVAKRQRGLYKQGVSEDTRKHFLVIDDCLYDSSWTRDKYMRYILSNRSNHQTLFILTMQYAIGIPPAMRENIDYVFILRENIISNRRRIYDQYTHNIFPEFEVFSQLLNEVFNIQQNNYKQWEACLVIDNTSTSTNVEDRVFYFTATHRRDLRLCAEEYWPVKEDSPA